MPGSAANWAARRAAIRSRTLALVYDLGGGTFDVTVVRYTPTHFQVLATDGDVHLGGIDWNDRMVDYVSQEFEAKHGIDPRKSPASAADAATRRGPGQDRALDRRPGDRLAAASKARA